MHKVPLPHILGSNSHYILWIKPSTIISPNTVSEGESNVCIQDKRTGTNDIIASFKRYIKMGLEEKKPVSLRMSTFIPAQESRGKK